MAYEWIWVDANGFGTEVSSPREPVQGGRWQMVLLDAAEEQPAPERPMKRAYFKYDRVCTDPVCSEAHDAHAGWTEIEYREVQPPEPVEPVRCVCGGEAAFLNGHGDGDTETVYVYCTQGEDADGYECWSGPAKPTRRDAIEAWNSLMQRAAGEGGGA